MVKKIPPYYFYVYRLTLFHPDLKKGPKYYHGSRGSTCSPRDDNYWSSSKIVKNYIKVSKADAGCETTKEHGGSWIKKKILAIYSTRAQALEHEIRLHKRLGVKNLVQFSVETANIIFGSAKRD